MDRFFVDDQRMSEVDFGPDGKADDDEVGETGRAVGSRTGCREGKNDPPKMPLLNRKSKPQVGGMDAITTVKTAAALVLAFAMGGLCGRFQIPLPAPPHWVGVALIAAIWLGYVCFKRS